MACALVLLTKWSGVSARSIISLSEVIKVGFRAEFCFLSGFSYRKSGIYEGDFDI